MKSSNSLDIKEKEKAIRLTDFLLEMANLRTKLIRDIKSYEEIFWISDLPNKRGCFTQAWGRQKEYDDDDVWIEIKTRKEPKCPEIPEQCKDWIENKDLQNMDKIPELKTQIVLETSNPELKTKSDKLDYITKTKYLKDYPEIQKIWEQYLNEEWSPWQEDHKDWEIVNDAYSNLYSIYQKQIKLGEEYELILGLGLLTWETPARQKVCRHLLVANALLNFEAKLGKFTVCPHQEGSKTRLELVDMLDIEERPVGIEKVEKDIKKNLEADKDDPWDNSSIKPILQSLVHSIKSSGDYEDSLKRRNIYASGKPIVEYSPALILRKRSTKGLISTLEKIKELITKDECIPSAFADLAEINLNNSNEIIDEQQSKATFENEIFFPKPSNDGQRQIVKKLQFGNGVLVQGPPGTGKSHTIANLICHLLATGQRMLITAKTPRALQALENLIPKQLITLCINLLGSGSEERRSLESSVNGILLKNDEWNEDNAKRDQAELEVRLRELREKGVELNRQIRNIKESETHPKSIADGNYRGTAARIAEAVNRDRVSYEWFTDNVPLNKPCQISTEELRNIVLLLRKFPPETRKELGLILPKTLPSPDDFIKLVNNEKIATEEEQNAAHETDEKLVNILRENPSTVIETIRSEFIIFQNSCKKLIVNSHAHEWIKGALHDILNGNSSIWHELLSVTCDIITSCEELVSVADETNTKFPNTADIIDVYEDARKIKEHLENGGKLSMLWGLSLPKVVKERSYIINSVSVNGHCCSTVDDFSKLMDVLHVQIKCKKAWDFWIGKTEKIEGPYALQLVALKGLTAEIENVLALEKTILNCREAIANCPTMNDPIWANESQIEQIIRSCNLALAIVHKRSVSEQFQNITAPISRMIAQGGTHPVVSDLSIAIQNRDIDKFACCYNTIKNIDKQRKQLHDIDEYIAKLSNLLPKFTNSLKKTYNEPYWEERALHIDKAWYWAQARYWIEDYILQEDLPKLEEIVKQNEEKINKIITKLASLHAWSFCFSRLNENHRRHMELWRQSMRKLGKGTGKHASRHLREAQLHLNECREAVPAWIMPLHRVWDTVDPVPKMFDIVIVDEASQCGFEALPLLYLGKKILIVGDDKQISPEAIGLSRDSVNRLIEKHLNDYEYSSSFDIESSLFDQGKIRYGTGRITLREHFRCMPEIIKFSNDLCYSDTPLIPLRQYSPNRLPPLEHVFISTGYREGSGNNVINRPEADAIVKRISEMCSDKNYNEKTMGVIVLQGESQASLIERKLLEQIGAEEIKKRRLVCGNSYSFQGDERDIIFLSLVAANNERIGALTKPADERRFNVAASRARDMMILFHSVTCDELSVSDLRRRLLEFFENTKPQHIAGTNLEINELEQRAFQDNRQNLDPPSPFDSWFEVDVFLELNRKGFTVIPQYKIAGKRIDLMVEGGQSRLAVECDGDKWHGADRYEEDMQRQRQLERSGWKFFRVRESVFYANKEACLEKLWQTLASHRIFTSSQYENTPTENIDPDNFKFDNTEDENSSQETDCLVDDSNINMIPSDTKAEEITTAEIRNAILNVLTKSSNRSCDLNSLQLLVLQEMKVSTSEKNQKIFDSRITHCLISLEELGVIKIYKDKNREEYSYINLKKL